MEQSNGIEFYLRFLNQCLAEIRAAVDKLLLVLPGNDQKQKVQALEAVRQAITNLLNGVSPEDRPAWAKRLQNAVNTYLDGPARQVSGQRLLKGILESYHDLASHQWTISTENRGIDFEGVYRQYFEQSRIPELFDELIDKIARVIESGKVDSIRVLRALEQVMTTARRNARGSYFSTRGAWKFTAAAFENFLWEALSDIPTLGAAVRAVRKTYEDLEKQIGQLDSQVHAEIGRLASPEVLGIAKVPESKLLQPAGERGEVAQEE